MHLADFKNQDGSAMIDITDNTQLLIADFDGNGIINIEDSTSIQKYIAGFVEV